MTQEKRDILAQYEDVISEFQERVASKMLETEPDLAERLPTIDHDIQIVLREVGRQATQTVAGTVIDQEAEKKI